MSHYDDCLPCGKKPDETDSKWFNLLHKALQHSKKKFEREVLSWAPAAGGGLTSVGGLLGTLNPAAATGHDDTEEIQAFLDTLTQEQLLELKKKVEESPTAEELKDDIMGYVLGVKEMGQKRLSAIDIQASFKEDKDEAAALGFTTCGLQSSVDHGQDAHVERPVEPHVVQVGCLGCGQTTEVQIEHHLLPGIRKEAELRRLLVEMPLPRLRKLLARFQESDASEAVMDEVVDLWKLHIFKSLDEATGATRDKLALASEEYSFVPGDNNNSYLHYFRSRWRHSNLHKYIGGFADTLELSPTETDTTVNAIILLDALILTIPFGILPNIGPAYWDQLLVNFQACPESSFPPGWNAEKWFYGWYWKTVTWMLATVFIVIGGISLSVFYYTNRPSDAKKFRLWWVTGRVCFYCIAMLAVIGVIMLLTILSCMLVIYATPTRLLCSTVNTAAFLEINTMKFNIFASSGLYCIIVFLNFVLTI